MNPDIKDLPNVDVSQESGFISFYRTLTKCVGASAQAFDRGEYYSVHEETAHLAANILFQTTSVIKKVGSGENKVDTVYLKQQMLETLMRELLLVKQYRITIFKQTPGKNEWKEEYRASPGNLEQVEDILFGGLCDQITNGGIMAVKTVSQGNNKLVGVGFIDVTNRVIQMSEFTDGDSFNNLDAMIVQLAPKECIVSTAETKTKLGQCLLRTNVMITERKKSDFNTSNTAQDLARLVKGWSKNTSTLNGRPELQKELALSAVNSIVSYLELTSNDANFNQFKCKIYNLNQFMRLDSAAIKSLLVEEQPGAPSQGSLLGVLDKCRTGLGHRMLAEWVRQPLMDLRKISERHDLVQSFVSDVELRNTVADVYLRKVPDLTRISRRLTRKQANLQDCHRLYQCYELLPDMCNALGRHEGAHAATITTAFTGPLQESLGDLSKFGEMIDTTLDLEHAKSGHYVIKPDFDEELLELRQKLDAVLRDMERELQSTACDLSLEAGKTIKLESNSQYGYFYRVTLKEEKALRNNRAYQTLDANKAGVRFRSTALSSLNTQHAEYGKEYEKQQSGVVTEILNVASGYISVINTLSQTLATLDCICSLASAAVSAPIPYYRPQMLPMGGTTSLKQCRHPCLEMMSNISYIPNDCTFDEEHGKFHIITGPNMGGKSTHLRAVATSILMAQIGSFVPCEEATIAVVDGIYTRVGAGDCQRKGVSTFMAEMMETATILKTATANSLIIIDELGRGTSTYDGCGLATAISEYIAQKIQCPCLFATHFHELTSLADTLPSVRNLHVAATTQENTLTLLYQVLPGPCDRSFGIHCAKIAHFPADVIKDAEEKAIELEQNFGSTDDDSEEAVNLRRKQKEDGRQLIVKFLKQLQHLQNAADEEIESAIEEQRAKLTQSNNPYIEFIMSTIAK